MTDRPKSELNGEISEHVLIVLSPVETVSEVQGIVAAPVEAVLEHQEIAQAPTDAIQDVPIVESSLDEASVQVPDLHQPESLKRHLADLETQAEKGPDASWVDKSLATEGDRTEVYDRGIQGQADQVVEIPGGAMDEESSVGEVVKPPEDMSELKPAVMIPVRGFGTNIANINTDYACS